MEDWKYNKARRRVKKVKGFYVNFASWLLFSVFFIFTNLTAGRFTFRSMYLLFPVLGWGIGVLFHAISVFGLPGFGQDWEERMIEREMDRIDREDQQLNDWDSDNSAQNSPSSHDYTEEDPPLRLKKLRKDLSDSDFV